LWKRATRGSAKLIAVKSGATALGGDPAVEQAQLAAVAKLRTEEAVVLSISGSLTGENGPGLRIKPDAALTAGDADKAAECEWSLHLAHGLVDDVDAALRQVALEGGRIATPGHLELGELVIFEPGNPAIWIDAIEDSEFVLGSARRPRRAA
jgi:hypothetical protein